MSVFIFLFGLVAIGQVPVPKPGVLHFLRPLLDSSEANEAVSCWGIFTSAILMEDVMKARCLWKSMGEPWGNHRKTIGK